jgi:predicted peroxiredoxin
MRWTILLTTVVLAALLACQNGITVDNDAAVKDGVFIHLKSGPEDAHSVLMALQMAFKMSDDKDVAVYMDIKAVNVFVKDAPDLAVEPFPSARTLLDSLLARNVPVMVCPGCMQVAGLKLENLVDGIKMADKETFFNFTKGRILTLDY